MSENELSPRQSQSLAPAQISPGCTGLSLIAIKGRVIIRNDMPDES